MPNYEVITKNEGYRNYSYFDNRMSAYDFAAKNKPSEILFKRKKVKVFK